MAIGRRGPRRRGPATGRSPRRRSGRQRARRRGDGAGPGAGGPSTAGAGRSAGADGSAGNAGPGRAAALAKAQADLMAMGIDADLGRRGDREALRALATESAVAAARAVGVDLKDGAGNIDPARALEAVAATLRRSVDDVVAGRLDDGVAEARETAARTAEALGIDVRRPDGELDPDRLRQAVEVGLDRTVLGPRAVTRAEARAALTRAIEGPRGGGRGSRQDALRALQAVIAERGAAADRPSAG